MHSLLISSRRHLEVADDPSLSEDAHFVLDVAWPTGTTDTVNYVGLADGVGSWRRVGVDPRDFRQACDEQRNGLIRLGGGGKAVPYVGAREGGGGVWGGGRTSVEIDNREDVNLCTNMYKRQVQGFVRGVGSSLVS